MTKKTANKNDVLDISLMDGTMYMEAAPELWEEFAQLAEDEHVRREALKQALTKALLDEAKRAVIQ